MGSSREVIVEMAELAEQAKLYDEMGEYMEKLVVLLGGKLNTKERNLFARSFYHVAGLRRNSWRIVSTAESSEKVRSDPDLALAVKRYKKLIDIKSSWFAFFFIRLLVGVCIPNACTADEKLFYRKLLGDYFRCNAEITTGATRSNFILNAVNLYRNQQKIEASELPRLIPAMIHQELTFVLFKYEILELVRPEATPRTGDVSMLVKKLQDELLSWSTYGEQVQEE